MEYKQIGKTNVKVSAVGQGTMGIGGYFTSDTSRDAFYVDIIKKGIDYGMTFIDTAEAYGAGHSEELVGQAMKSYRKDVFVATKVSPEHLSYDAVIKSAEGSLRRLQTDYIDLYQIHWPHPAMPIEETIRAMERLVKDGKVRYVGVSNFSLKELMAVNKAFGNNRILSLQIEYNLFDRTIEEDILPYCEQERISVIAYSPLDQGGVCRTEKHEVLQEIASKYNKTPAQIALKWLVSKPSVFAIPKAININHLKDNASSTDFDLEAKDIELINRTCIQHTISIPTDRIRVDNNGLEKFIPSPHDLAKCINDDLKLKPIRVKTSEDPSGPFDYDLVEGKVRYWAWVFAHGGKIPIQALVR